MGGWWTVGLVVAIAGPLVAWWVVSPWARCRPCRGCGTVRHRRSGKFVGHCRRCGGLGSVERAGRRFLRSITRGRLFRHPPERPYEGQLYGRANRPFAGRHPGGSARRRAG